MKGVRTVSLSSDAPARRSPASRGCRPPGRGPALLAALGMADGAGGDVPVQDAGLGGAPAGWRGGAVPGRAVPRPSRRVPGAATSPPPRPAQEPACRWWRAATRSAARPAGCRPPAARPAAPARSRRRPSRRATAANAAAGKTRERAPGTARHRRRARASAGSGGCRAARISRQVRQQFSRWRDITSARRRKAAGAQPPGPAGETAAA